MTELGSIVIAWCIGLTITYGIVESALFSPVRLLVARWELSRFLVYCPFCCGFWCFGFSAWAMDWTHPMAFVRGAAIGTMSLLVSRAVARDLIQSPYESEREAIAEVTAMKDGMS